MSVEKVREYLKGYGVADRMQEFTVSSATVELAAVAVGVEPARIAKTLSFKVDETPILIVAAGPTASVHQRSHRSGCAGLPVLRVRSRKPFDPEK